MFDIGFSEIVVCAIVALIVIGPERMPAAVRAAGLWVGRLKRSLRETRVDIERQMGIDDIRRQLHNEDIMQTLDNARNDIDKLAVQTQVSLNAISTAHAHEYHSEPDLPYHAHREDKPEQATELLTDYAQHAAKVTTLADHNTLTNNPVTSDKKTAL